MFVLNIKNNIWINSIFIKKITINKTITYVKYKIIKYYK
jgi:hypothetical protein